MSFKVKIGNTGQTVECPAEDTVLIAAVRAGVDYPYACATGNCGTCISELEAGQVELLPYGDGALTKKQKAAGLTLPCRALPRSDLELRWLTQAPAR